MTCATAVPPISRPASRPYAALTPDTTVEILVPDFRGRMQVALEQFAANPPDVFNHNLETVPRLYRQARPGADYQWSLDLLRQFKALHPARADQIGHHARPGRDPRRGANR